MKKIASFVLSLSLLIVFLIPVSSVSAYNGGLMNGKSMSYGPGFDVSKGTTNFMTDNDESTYFTLHAQHVSSQTVYDNAWSNFGLVHTVGSYKLLSGTSGQPNLAFFDASGNLLKVITPVTDGTLQLIEPIPGVKSVDLSNGYDTPTDVYEFDVFDAVLPDAPILTGVAGVGQNSLSWSAVENADFYTIKRSLTSGGPYTVIGSIITDLGFVDTAVTAGTTYYYILTATNLNGESASSNEVALTPQTEFESRGLLTIYISGGQIKEYDLSAAELNAFLSWYDAKDAGSGPAKYKFVKTWNKGPFKTRAEYVIFDKILTFDVDEYEVENP
ncbi:fibronectin type III domain-containing protein [Cohnella sp. LGH]|uniref:fibronectin type III domain-containing protein n=1 Tax=Cohnella sp. LGH TaxID=1619153 RepID=UPI001ADBED95|nr:fibronectin type III domain-containing protein [Cohnella sp. LGH]QTH44979.1 fibronectin type III domain-containing protein [Cohnella sp. LGH]